VLAPAPGLAVGRAREAQQLALELAAELDVTGLLAVELFETPRGLLVNELAMRPHNSGHWTIEGSRRRSSSSTGSVPGAAMPPGDLQPTARPAQARVSSDDGVYGSMPGTTPRTTVK
jgi:hypothetical protein